MKSLHYHLYQTAVGKFTKFKSRLDKNIASGRFKKFAKSKQGQLLGRLERLRRQALRLHFQLKLTAAGAVFALLATSTPVKAQTAVGPFNQNYIGNPLPPPVPFTIRPTPVFADLDGDGDQDLIFGGKYGFSTSRLRFYENIGSSQKAFFKQVQSGDPNYPFTAVDNSLPGNVSSLVPAFADIDGDADLDMLVGADVSVGLGAGPIMFYRNNGSTTTPDFQQETGNANPFDGLQTKRYPHPHFADTDNDGDFDLLIGGYFNSATYSYLLQYYVNEGTATNPAYVDASTYSPRPSILNWRVVNDYSSSYSSPMQMADLDEDGDLDFFFSLYGSVVYLRNNSENPGEEFISADYDATQTGPWIPDANNPGASQGNPFDIINQDKPDNVTQYTSFAFVDLDSDGDKDVALGYHFNGYSEITRSFVYYENTGQGVFQKLDGVASPVDGVLLGSTANTSLADIDGDGDMDIIATGSVNTQPNNCDCFSYSYGTAELYRNDGGGNFSKQEFPLLDGVTLKKDGTIQFIDVDKDGDLDLLAPYYDDIKNGGSYYGLIQYFRNDDGVLVEQTGTANPFSFAAASYNEVYLDLGDLDNDGDLDAVLVRQGLNLTMYENIGGNSALEFVRNTNWENDLRSSSAYYSTKPRFLDLDHDGDLDMVTGKYENLWYFENIGSPTAPQFVMYAEGDYYDADDHLILAENNPFRLISVVGNNSSNPSLIDVDGDGDMDMILGLPNGTFSYYENQNPTPSITAATDVPFANNLSVILDPDLILDDADGDYIVRAVITLSNYDPSTTESLTTGTLPGGITSTFEQVGTDGVLTLSGRATLADYQAALRTVAYVYSEPSAGRTSGGSAGRTINKTVTIVALDSDYTRNTNNTISINLTHANGAPVLNSVVTSLTYNGGSLTIDSAIGLTDPDDSRFASGLITISFTGGTFVAGQDVLAVTPVSGITQSFNAGTGTLTISGTGTVPNFEAVLRTLRYSNASGTPNKQARQIRIVANDGQNNSNAITIAINYPNSAPLLGTITTSASFTGTPVVIDNGIVVTDADNSLASATIQITSGLVAAEDQLVFVDQNGITGSYDAATGTLSLAGVTTVANYATALQSVTYSNTGTNRTAGTRVVQFTVNDGSASSNSTQISIGVTNASPALSTTTTTIQYSGTALSVDAALNVADSDNTNLTGATVSLSAGYQSGEDVLQFTAQNGITGSFNATTGVLTLTGTTTLANYQAALRSVTYQNVATNRTNASRTISIQVSDGTNNSNLIGITLQVPNVVPAVVVIPNIAFTGSDLVIDNALQISDPDDVNLTGATINISSGYSQGEDVLVFTNQLGITGTFSVVAGRLTLSGTTTLANYQAALRTVIYRNSATDRTNQDRVITITVNDGTALSTGSAITLSVPNVQPAITLAATSLTYASGNLVLDAGLSTTDSDDNNYTGASVAISNGFVTGQDELVFANQNGITGSFNAATGVLTLTGTSSKANYATALQSIAFRNTSANPSPGIRTISFQVNDGQVLSNGVSLTVSISNSAPTLSSTNAPVFYGTGSQVIDATIVAGDADNTNLQGATVQITSGLSSSEDVLSFVNQAGISGTYVAATGTLTLTGASSVLNYQQALRSVAYQNTSANPVTADRIVTFNVTDGTNQSNGVTTTININRPPVVTVNSQTIGAGGSVDFAISSILSDPDNNLDLTTLNIVSQVGADVTVSGGQVVIDYGDLPNFKGTDVLTITVCDLAGRCQTQTVNISLDAAIQVYNGVSPDGNKANDYFKVRFLPAGSTVSIYNRWGDLVYEKKDYNSDVAGQRFEGNNNNGNELASGTYFYKIDTPDGKTITGYLTLKR